MKVTLKLAEDSLFDLMIALTELRTNGMELSIEIHEGSKDIPSTPEPDMIEHTAPVQTESVQMPSTGGAKRVVYRVIDPRIPVGRTPDTVRMVLLMRGPLSAQELEKLTGKGKKSIESSLWLLRNRESIESVEVQEGVTVTQEKFTKAQIKQGRALVPVEITLPE